MPPNIDQNKLPHHRRLWAFLIAFAIFGLGFTGFMQLEPGVKQSASTPSQFVTSQNGRLMLEGQPYTFTGINAYELPTDWGTNPGCGGMLTDDQLNSFFASLAPYSMVRFWAFQGSMAYDDTTGQLNWGPIDRVVNAATAHNIKLDVGLTDQAGTCDDGYWKDAAWYNGGYTTLRTNPNNYDHSVLPYDQYVAQIVTRYANNPTIAFWEPVNEPEASECSNPTNGSACEGNQTCTNESASAAALLSFFNAMGTLIRSIDPNHLIAGGTEGGGQCGLAGSDYQTVMASPGIDVATYHDYSAATDIIPGDQWNGLQVRINQMAAIHKPLISEEVGIEAFDPPPNGCLSLEQRAPLFGAKLTGQLTAGLQGFMPWDWVPPGSTTSCSLDINAGDPTISVLNQHAFVLASPPSNSGGGTTTGGGSTTSGSTRGSSTTSSTKAKASGTPKSTVTTTPTVKSTANSASGGSSSTSKLQAGSSTGTSNSSGGIAQNQTGIPIAAKQSRLDTAFRLFSGGLMFVGGITALILLYWDFIAAAYRHFRPGLQAAGSDYINQ